MDKVIVFGGSFNPPTKAHLSLGIKAVEFAGATKLCFVPVGDKYGKESLLNSKYRVDMLNIIRDNNPHIDIAIELVEVSSNKNISTLDTLNVLRNKYKDAELYFLLGADNLMTINNWKSPEELLTNFKIIAVNRNGKDIKRILREDKFLNRYKENIIPMDIDKEIPISSTMIRNSVKNNDYRLKDYVDEEIIDYIKSNDLYKYKEEENRDE